MYWLGGHSPQMLGHAGKEHESQRECWTSEGSQGKRPYFGWHYLSTATCLRRPQLCYACFVVSSMYIYIYIYI